MSEVNFNKELHYFILGYVRLVTNYGPLNLELHCDIVPKTCENFMKLCQTNYYNGTVFHRLIKHFMVRINLIYRKYNNRWISILETISKTFTFMNITTGSGWRSNWHGRRGRIILEDFISRRLQTKSVSYWKGDTKYGEFWTKYQQIPVVSTIYAQFFYHMILFVWGKLIIGYGIILT